MKFGNLCKWEKILNRVLYMEKVVIPKFSAVVRDGMVQHFAPVEAINIYHVTSSY